MAAVCAFVDRIGASPVVLLDLNDETLWRVLKERTNLDPPPLRRAVMNSFLTDGDYVPAAAYGNRELVLDLLINVPDTTPADDIAEQVSLLARQLDQPTNILMWQPDGATYPVFFRTKRSPLGKEGRLLNSVRRAEVPIMAEPFALGTTQTLTLVNVENDPSLAGANGCYFEVQGALGDVETPLWLKFASADVTAAGRRTSVIAVRRRGTPANAATFIQAEAMTLAASTTLPGNDALMSGSGSNYARAATLTGSFVTRLTSAIYPSAATNDIRGTYRCYVRCRHNTGGDEIRLQLLVSGDGTNTVQPDDPIILASGTTIRWADLGLVQLPIGPDPGFDINGQAIPCRGVEFRLQAAITSGSGTLDVDCILLLPADDRLVRITWPSQSGPTTRVLDSSSTPNVYSLDAGDATYSTEVPNWDAGGTPMISPGSNVINRIWFLLDAGTTSTAGDTLTNDTDITAYYQPRYLTARPLTEA